MGERLKIKNKTPNILDILEKDQFHQPNERSDYGLQKDSKPLMEK